MRARDKDWFIYQPVDELLSMHVLEVEHCILRNIDFILPFSHTPTHKHTKHTGYMGLSINDNAISIG